MSISIQRYQSDSTSMFHASGTKGNQEDTNTGSTGNIQASELQIGNMWNDSSEQALQTKKKGAKESMKLLLDQFTSDLKADSQMEGLKGEKEAAAQKLGTYQENLDTLSSMRADLKDNYEITDDSQEEADLNLLRKQQNAPDSLTEEEKAQLENMGELTDYQKESLDLDKKEKYWNNLAKDAKSFIENTGKSIDDMKLERLKSDPMVNANKNADKIMEAANKEAADILMDEAVETVKDTFGQEDDTKKADETDEEDDKKKTDKNTDDSEKSDAQPEAAEMDSQDSPEVFATIQEKQKVLIQKVQELIKTQNLTNEDLKGIDVDTEL